MLNLYAQEQSVKEDKMRPKNSVRYEARANLRPLRRVYRKKALSSVRQNLTR
ncbi:hypothetical protein CAMRE0001_1128 [Campylobacter rectus RM3267]|uniref:Uncharacterized protein n=1 Tax=Campylobacter rectus RM3267 TaxID=553218 RepID=B9D0C8_CAMRE|nr:hypothetical protein CAMRE0001_1128 [Campylobacter rectus RM3267]